MNLNLSKIWDREIHMEVVTDSRMNHFYQLLYLSLSPDKTATTSVVVSYKLN